MDDSAKISAQIEALADWRGSLLAELRTLVNSTAPELQENFKWGVPVWSSNGLVCAISAFKGHVKMNFFKGAYLTSFESVFNSGLDSKEHRSINFAESDKPNTTELKALLLAAVAYNQNKS